MARIVIPFQERWRELMLDGVKTCTSRNKRYGWLGDTFEVFGEAFLLTAVEELYLKDVSEVLFIEEGCKSPEEFEGVWKKLHPRKGWWAYQKVWVHHFEQLKQEIKLEE